MQKDRSRLHAAVLALAAAAVLPASTALAQMELVVDLVVNGGNSYNWQRVALPGTVCGNGSQYKFWYYDSPTSNNMVVMFEGGGACWDYDTCSGRAGVLGASNANGLPDNYIDGMAPRYVSPIVNGADPGLPFRSKRNIATNGWDMVYMPYCTGDVHTGNSTATYVDQTGANPPLVWRHAGYNNTVAAANFLRGRFPSIGKLLVTGFSAGGVGTATQYFVMRRTLRPTVKGYSLNDSGPLFPAPNSTYKSWLLHRKIEVSWNLASVYPTFPASFTPSDVGTATRAIATEFPTDQHAYTGYMSDYNFSRFSYERFYPGITQAGVLANWRADMNNLVNTMNLYANFSYHIPWHRPLNDSHCSAIITFVGSHACSSIRKKYWYEYILEPWQSWKCTGTFKPFETFFDQWVINGTRSRIKETENYYNNEDPGMATLNTLVSAAL
ncbi:MAG TPA: pectin acetylesterase-family hydrolase [Candidatus Binatia bacterium]|nr:pectin acetylesterase-family hydrolase [Candidatus Binatia bacterium]